jgi:hypothetical protein
LVDKECNEAMCPRNPPHVCKYFACTASAKGAAGTQGCQ